VNLSRKAILAERALSKNSSGYQDAAAASLVVFSPLVHTRVVQKLIRSPECAHGAQDTGDPGGKQVPQNAQIVSFGGTPQYGPSLENHSQPETSSPCRACSSACRASCRAGRSGAAVKRTGRQHTIGRGRCKASCDN